MSYIKFIFFCFYVLTAIHLIADQKQEKPKKTTLIVFIAGDNDLFPFAGRNIKQMQTIGSNDFLTIAIHFDMRRPGQAKVTKRFVVEKNKLVQIGPDMCMDSGDIKTLTSCCEWAIKSYPADDYMLVLWNHGTGVLEPTIKQAINPSQLFKYNPNMHMIELDRSIGFMNYINQQNGLSHEQRGICFDDSTGNYLTNQKLKEALQIITREYLSGNPFKLLAFDACLMGAIEVAALLDQFAEIVVFSEEVVLGTGFDYSRILTPFLNGAPDTQEFAKHIVSSYEKTYSKITNDFTQSAILLKDMGKLVSSVDRLAIILINGLRNQKNRSVREAIRLSRHKNFCTHFDEPTYIDLGHFCSNLLQNIQKAELKDSLESTLFIKNTSEIINTILKLISHIVIANTAGKNLHQAQGLSIYFPEYQIHSSYKKAEFATITSWLKFLNSYLTS